MEKQKGFQKAQNEFVQEEDTELTEEELTTVAGGVFIPKEEEQSWK